jgi:hypothetical protein
MIKITEQTFEAIMKNDPGNFGYICAQGAVVGDAEFVLYAKEHDYYLLHISEVEVKGLYVRVPKKENEG